MTTPVPSAAAPTGAAAANFATEESGEELVDTIHLLLGSRLRVTMTDGRVADGKFLCLDRLCNIVLEDVVEHRRVAAHVPSAGGALSGADELRTWDTERSLSQAVIPGDRLAKVEIAKEEWKARVGKGSNR